ncbi:MAG: amidophosphoribosyltransferase [Alistipes sp.]|nr:amidophosphoribosyltransferase [Alistipes sp.]
MSVLGVYGVEHTSSIIYYGLHTMQHRGQEGCGMVCVDHEGNMKRHRGLGLVSEVFNEQKIAALDGKMGIGHVLYTGAASRGVDNVQPLYFRHGSGDFALAHNGNVVNAEILTAALENRGSLFHSHSDAELLAHLIKKDNPDEPRIFSIIEALRQMEGAFVFLIMTKNRLYACRDKYGFHPLSIGKIGDGYVVSSETCAFDTIGAQFVRDVAPGEIVTIDKKGIRSSFYTEPSECKCKMCAMEYIYFARPDSDIDGCNVHAYRKESGRRLFKEAPADADIVVGVPDSSLSAAQGYSEASGLPYEMGLIKNKYVGRTFIQPSQALREKGVRMKLSPVRSIVSGKRVVLVDDSIVRGTTSRRIVNMLRESGATEVHVRIASPTMTHPCFYGVDTSTLEELMLARMNVEEACKAIGADSLAFLSYESTLKSALNRTDMCLACFDGNYPTELYKSIEEINK